MAVRVDSWYLIAYKSTSDRCNLLLSLREAARKHFSLCICEQSSSRRPASVDVDVNGDIF